MVCIVFAIDAVQKCESLRIVFRRAQLQFQLVYLLFFLLGELVALVDIAVEKLKEFFLASDAGCSQLGFCRNLCGQKHEDNVQNQSHIIRFLVFYAAISTNTAQI